MWKLPKGGHDTQGNILAILGEVHVPLVASGQLDGVRCLIVGCCVGESGLMVAPSVHQGGALVLAILLKLVQALPQLSPI
jgi:hypothetical protein